MKESKLVREILLGSCLLEDGGYAVGIDGCSLYMHLITLDLGYLVDKDEDCSLFVKLHQSVSPEVHNSANACFERTLADLLQFVGGIPAEYWSSSDIAKPLTAKELDALVRDKQGYKEYILSILQIIDKWENKSSSSARIKPSTSFNK